MEFRGLKLLWIAVWLLLGCTFAVIAPTSALAQSASAPSELAIAFAARVVGDENRARLIVDFDKKVKHDAYLLDQPRRIIIDLSETVFTLEGESQRLPKSLVSDMRYGTVASGQSRVVLELAKTVVIEGHSLRPTESDGRHRLIVDLVSAPEDAFKKAVRKVVAPVAAKKAPIDGSESKAQKRFKIVLDPGHGGIDGGARGQGNTVEKNVTLQFAQRLASRLRQRSWFDVLLTREKDDFVALGNRVAFARENKADLFISIHADSLRQKDIRGATIYTLSKRGSDALSNALARKQNRADLVAGLSLPESEPDVTDILIDLTRRETVAFSTRLAGLMVARMKDKVRLIRNPHRSADFFVLKAPEIPSVLLELGYLSNREDESLMLSAEWQNRAVTTVSEAIEGFFEPRLVQK